MTWQLEWKRPEWHSVPQEDSYSVIDHAAAELNLTEAEALELFDDTFLITASLLSTRDSKDADSLRLQVLGGDGTIKLTKLLRWPASLSNREGVRFLNLVRANHEATAHDALDVLQLLSKKRRTNVQQGYLESLMNMETVDLQLWVFTNTNTLHVYKVMDLFQKTPQPNQVESMLFGDLLESIQASVSPLAEPMASKHLLSANKAAFLHWDVAVAVETLQLVEPEDPIATHTFVTLEYWVLAGKVRKGGFVTLVHLSNVQPTRTLYFPLTPNNIFSFVLDRDFYIGVADANGSAVAIDLKDFVLLPIRVPSQSLVTGCSDYHSIVKPPCLVEWQSHADLYVTATRYEIFNTETIAEYENPLYKRYEPPTEKRILLTRTLPVVATIRVKDDDILNWQIQTGQGWSFIVSSMDEQYFICWEGGTTTNGAVIKRIRDEGAIKGIMRAVLPERPVFWKDESEEDSALPSASVDDDIVERAMQSVSSERFREGSPVRGKKFSFSSEEKAKQLFRQCSSWAQLEEEGSVEVLNKGIPVAIHAAGGRLNYLTLRRRMVENGEASPFSQILTWLSSQDDFRTATKLALQLLHDGRTMQYLLEGSDGVEDGLLDGLRKVISDDHDESIRENTRVQLADMAVACMVKGGYEMSDTLQVFLDHNRCFDRERACIMLAAASALALSEDENTVNSAMGKSYTRTSHHEEDILWPVRSLMKVGNKRGCTTIALRLLNAAIPDAIRGRSENHSDDFRQKATARAKAIVSTIVRTCPPAVKDLLELVDEQSMLLFWDSLDHQTRLEISLIPVNDIHPLLNEAPVRQWVRKMLSDTIISYDNQSSAPVSSDWLRRLLSSSFFNGGCDFLKLTANSTRATEDEPELFVSEMKMIREAITPSVDSTGLDYAIVIASLLLLCHRDEEWLLGSKISAQNVLNSLCFLAGRSDSRQSQFPLEEKALMKECAMMGNVQAAGNLVGGRNGLLIECCDALMKGMEWEMDQSEEFILSEAEPPRRQGKGPFQLGPELTYICWLLEENVLSIRRYGDFEISPVEGNRDPVLAARFCLRTWWCLSAAYMSEASTWLVSWLRMKLEIGEAGISTHRLACAALCRALLWPGDDEYGAQNTLSTRMKFPNDFMVELARSCCGLIESVPPSVAASLAVKDNATVSHVT